MSFSQDINPFDGLAADLTYARELFDANVRDKFGASFSEDVFDPLLEVLKALGNLHDETREQLAAVAALREESETIRREAAHNE
jgi:hypothetical protein